MVLDVARPARCAVARDVGGGGAGEDAGAQEQTRFERRWLREAEADADVEAVADQVAEAIADDEVDGELGVLGEERLEAWCQHEQADMPASTLTRRRPRTLAEAPPASMVASSMALMCGAMVW